MAYDQYGQDSAREGMDNVVIDKLFYLAPKKFRFLRNNERDEVEFHLPFCSGSREVNQFPNLKNI